jgi:flavin reductase (DIM6/NTAB) family NADH-FMN oxidoreductase RutF
MDIDLSTLSAGQVYQTVIQTLIPRPVAWVLSENQNRSFNLAPFSYFNALSSDPPLLMFSVGKRDNGSFKDTRVNIEARRLFVLHIPSAGQVQAVNDSSTTLQPEESEVDKLALPTTEFAGFPLPRINDCPVAYGCELFELKEIGNTPMSIIIGEIKRVYIDDDIIESAGHEPFKVSAGKLNPLARLGGIEYAALGELMSVPRPK